MNSIVLTDEEISAIKSLIKDVVDIPVIESIYVKPVIRKEREPKIDIRVLLTDDVEYNTLMKKLGVKRDVETEVRDFNQLSSKYCEIFENTNNGRCNLVTEWSKLYVPYFTIFEEEHADEELVNGTIVYDRFGHLTYTKEIVGISLKGDPRLPLIENINAITNEESKNSKK